MSFYLGDMDTRLPKGDQYLLKIVMAASKKAITRRWLCGEPPTIDQWAAIVTNIQCMERMTFNLRLQKDKYDALWEKWDTYLTRRDDNPLCF